MAGGDIGPPPLPTGHAVSILLQPSLLGVARHAWMLEDVAHDVDHEVRLLRTVGDFDLAFGVNGDRCIGALVRPGLVPVHVRRRLARW